MDSGGEQRGDNRVGSCSCCHHLILSSFDETVIQDEDQCGEEEYEDCGSSVNDGFVCDVDTVELFGRVQMKCIDTLLNLDISECREIG